MQTRHGPALPSDDWRYGTFFASTPTPGEIQSTSGRLDGIEVNLLKATMRHLRDPSGRRRLFLQ